MPTLYIFSGLPGTGKTTLAKHLASQRSATYLRIDTIEQTFREQSEAEVHGEGYALAYAIAADNLRLGVDVVADSCNTIEVTRRAWEQVATNNNSSFVNIEVTCKDSAEHRRRVETRDTNIPGLQLPDWDAVINRHYEKWESGVLSIDTSDGSIDDSFNRLKQLISNHEKDG